MIGLGLPLDQPTVHKSFFLSFVAMSKPVPARIILPEYPQHIGFLDMVRNNIVEQALRDEMTHLIFMDTDQVYPEDTIEKLLSHDLDIVGGVVHRRYPPFDAILYRGELHKYTHVPDEECYSGDLIEIEATGTGCMCIKTDVFKKVEPPWFKYGANEGRKVGEDIYFCNKVRQAGLKIYADTSVQIDHMATVAVNRPLYEFYKQTQGYKWSNEEN